MISLSSQTTLVLAAHPDDEVLGCGGTIARLAAEGTDVHIAILGEGITSRVNRRDDADRLQVANLHQESKEVGMALGARSVVNFNLPDNRFDTVPLLEVVKIVEGLIETHRPDTVFTQHGGDLNIDHTVLFRATLTATRPMAGASVQRLYAYEVNSSSEWSFQQFSPAFRPTSYIDIASTLERKIAAMEMYESEARAFPHPRSPEALRACARRHGATAGLTAAEAFACIRDIFPAAMSTM